MIFDRYRAWFRELSTYHRHLSWEEFWVRYAVARMRANETVPSPTADETTVRAWWATNEYAMLRQAYYHRNHAWPEIKARLPKSGTILEYGCGIAPVSTWLADHTRARAHYTLVDLPSPALGYATWRMHRRNASARVLALAADFPAIPPQDVIVCLEVLEHVPNPASVMRHLVASLRAGGTLFVNFVGGVAQGANLQSAQDQRKEAMAALDFLHCEIAATAGGQTGVYRA